MRTSPQNSDYDQDAQAWDFYGGNYAESVRCEAYRG